MHRRRLIRSGNFGGSSSLFQRKNIGKKEGLCTVKRSRVCALSGQFINATLNLSYTIYRPELLQSMDKKPILFIHGGPSIPSDYLQPIAQQAYLKDRCVIFYDQIGCGNSSIPKDIEQYSIEKTVDDLEHFIQHLKLKQFHLYGHSFGAIVAYEYSKRLCEGTVSNNKRLQTCNYDTQDNCVPEVVKVELLTVTLCSAPSNLQKVDNGTKLLMKSIRPRSNSVDTESSSDTSLDATIDEESTEDCYDLFHKHFVCRTSDGILPRPLQEAYRKKGDVWEGTDAIIEYVAKPPSMSASIMPPTLLLRGEYDFVSKQYGFDEWKKLLNHNSVFCQTLNGCSHYSMLENGELHSLRLNAFLVQHERV